MRDLEKKLNYSFRNPALLEEALNHSSYANEHRAAGLVKGDLGQMKKLMDPSEVGGTPFLGIQKPVIKAHGGSNARAIENAVLRAKEYAESGFIADIQANIEHMRVQPAAEKN